MTPVLGSLLKLAELILSLFKAASWLVNELGNKLGELAAKSRREDVQKAIDYAKRARTREEKIKAACELEKKINPRSDCGSISDGGKEL